MNKGGFEMRNKKMLVIFGAIIIIGSIGVAGISVENNLSTELILMEKYFDETAFGQMLDEGWPLIMDEGIEDAANAMTYDSEGNIIVTGHSFDLEPFVSKIILLKIDISGNQVWNISWDGPGVDYAADIVVDSQDNIIVYGANASTLDEFHNLSINMFLIKFDKNGNEIWQKNFRRGNNTFPGGIAIDSNDNIILGEGFGNLSFYEFTSITTKFDPDGQELWSRIFQEDMMDIASAVAVDSQDNIINSGFFIEFFVGQGLYNIKYDSNGNQIWMKRLDNTMQPVNMIIDYEDNIIIGGQGFTQTSSKWSTIKCDGNSKILWERQYFSGEGDYSSDIDVDSQGNIIIVGSSGFGQNNNSEHCAIYYDKNGKELGLKRSNINGHLNAVIFDNQDSVIVGGTVRSEEYNWDFYVDKYVDLTPPSSTIAKPEDKILYLFDSKIMPTVLSKKSVIIGKITIEVNTEDANEVDKIEFYIDHVLKQTVDNPPYKWTWNEMGFGDRTITTIVYDETGAASRNEIMVFKIL